VTISRGVAFQVIFFASAGGASALPPPPDLAGIVLRREGQRAVDLQALVREQRLTVVVFYSSSCPCFAAHRARLATLADDLSPRGVRVLVVDSERHRPGDAALPVVAETSLPILRDDDGRLARRLDAHFATETFVFDATGTLRYRGGIDDERKYLSERPKTYLRDALSALLSGTAPRFAAAKTLGCALRLF
jgi:hypothetical protein